MNQQPLSPEFIQADGFNKKYLHKVLSRYPVTLICETNSVPEKIERFGFEFRQQQNVDVDRARQAIVPLIREFIEMISQDKTIQPYLDHHDYEKLLSLDLFFVGCSGLTCEDPYISSAMFGRRGVIYYFLSDPRSKRSKAIHEETYAEALARLDLTQRCPSALASTTPLSTACLEADRFNKKYAHEILSKYSVELGYESNSVPNAIERFEFAFSQQNALGVDGARRMIIPLVEEFMEMLSEDREIQPYLAHREYPKLLRLKVRFFDGDSGLTQRAPYISFVVFDKGEGIKYLVFDPSEGPDYQTVYEETHQEALDRIEKD